jgi:polyhydroxyalkanoate synthesis repressor PhaR
MDDETVQIRRYPNRRFYDRQRRQYITLGDIEALVKSGKTVEVRDSRSDEDITRSILTQIILERHPERMAMFPVGMLHSMLRANDAVCEFFRESLRQSMEYLDRMPKGPVPPFGAVFRQPMSWMESILRSYPPRNQKAESPGDSPPAEEPPPEEPPPEEPPPEESPFEEGQLDTMATRLAALESRLQSLESSGNKGADADPQAVIERLQRRIRELESVVEQRDAMD